MTDFERPMTFPAEEYQRRVNGLRERMEQRLLDAVVISDPENLMYLTDYQTTGYSFFQALVVPLDGEPFFVTRAMEESNVLQRTWVTETRPYPDNGDAIGVLVLALNEFGLGHATIGYERNSYFLPAYQQDRIHTAFDRGRLLDCFGIVEEGRMRKSPAEIELMRKAATATQAGMAAGIDAVHAGVTENDIAAAICDAMFRAGGEFPAVLPYVTSGPRTMIGHATWEGRTVQPGEHVFLEVGGCYRRYHTAMMRTVVLDELSPSMQQAEERMQTALKELRRFIQPGLTVSDADNIVRNIISDNDVGARLVTRSGYSIGIAFPPAWDEGYILSLNQGDSTILQEGMTFHVIPWMWGVDGDKTVGTSDTLHVTADGCESFFDLPETMTAKPDQAHAVVGTVPSPRERDAADIADAAGPDDRATDTA